MEHTPLSAREVTSMVHAVANASHGKTASLVRIPAAGVEYVKWALDSGANGIVVPMVQSREEAERVVRYAKYPPIGQRSFGPFNAAWADPAADKSLPKYFGHARQPGNIAVIVMIESKDGIDNAEEIMSVPGVDGIFVGPVDMRLSLSLGGADGDEGVYVDALKKVVALSKKLDLVSGIFSAGPEALKKHVSLGFSYSMASSDTGLISVSAKAAIEASRKAVNAAKL
jgi:2-keto-3-deoxy-L-rhamnonate aldolase RhmA